MQALTELMELKEIAEQNLATDPEQEKLDPVTGMRIPFFNTKYQYLLLRAKIFYWLCLKLNQLSNIHYCSRLLKTEL